MKKILLFVLMLVSVVSYSQNHEIRLFSHRGGRLEFDENTMSAFKASFDAGYRGFEIDVRYICFLLPLDRSFPRNEKTPPRR